MKRIISSIVILALILLFCCWSVWQTERICSDMTGLLRDAEQKYLLGDYEEAETLLLRSRQYWDRHRAFLGITLHHNDLDTITLSFPILLETCRQKNPNEFSMENQVLISTLTNLAGMEWPHFYHIL